MFAFRLLITLCSMKISAKKTEEWREVKEEGLEYGLKKYVLFKGDIPSKRVEYRDPAGKSYKNSSQALKQLNKTKSKGKETKKEKKSKKRKSDTNHCPETAGDEMSSSKRRNKAQELRNVKQRQDDFLLNSIREKEAELECPVCLETAVGGEIFSCIHQHLVCSQCRPRVRKCPTCRQPYPPTPLRHRYAEKMAVELQNLREKHNTGL